MHKIAVCTIVAKNYLAFARTLFQSIQRWVDEVELYVLVVDEVGVASKADEILGVQTLAPLDVIGATLFSEMSFRYDVTELCTAIKPSLLSHLLLRGHEQAMYFDPDILVLQPLDGIVRALSQSNVVLTPHLDAPIPLDSLTPDELTILKCGAYNLGFIGVRDSSATGAFLGWWAARLGKYAANDVEAGLFTDQKWIDFVPGMVPGVCILRSPVYNVAYWNIHGRRLHSDDCFSLASGERIVFFHFSGFDPADMVKLSKYQSRSEVVEGSSLWKLLRHYAELLRENQYDEYRALPYGYCRFTNGIGIDYISRRAMREALSKGLQFVRPHDVGSKPSFFEWLNKPHRNDDGKGPPYLTNYLATLHAMRPDLQAAFPDEGGGGKAEFFNWLDAEKHDFDRTFIEHAKLPSYAAPESPGLYPGVNAIGYFRAESGTGEAGRAYVKALEDLDVPLALIDFSHSTLSRQRDDSINTMLSSDNPHAVNLLLINADELPHFTSQMSREFFANKYNIGSWYWELPEFPEEWDNRFEQLDEVWVGSSFVQDAVSRRSPIPVIRIPLVVAPGDNYGSDKTHFGLAPSTFCFLFLFDYLSFFERKNPMAAVEAFQAAFPGNDVEVCLVIKCINWERDQVSHARLRERISADQRIVLFDDYLSRDEKNALIASCDAYVSLHRSEGFGLTIAEAMYFGKPVIATGWSGNMDFMDASNSFPVEYQLGAIQEGLGPYKAGQIWADANVGTAARFMRELATRPELGRERGLRAARTIREKLSGVTVSRLIAARLRVAASVLRRRGVPI